jgi:DNA gyrase subunit B
VGISVVNALSEALTVQVSRDGNLHTMKFAKGIPQTDLVIAPNPGGAFARGTRVLFKPDPEIFKTTTDFDFEKLAARVDELAYLNAGLTLRMIDRRSLSSRKRGGEGGESTLSAVVDDALEEQIEGDDPSGAVEIKTYRHDGGIAELVKVLTADNQELHAEIDVIKIKDERKGVQVEAALRWSKDFYSEALSGFANGIRTSDGGSHLEGLKAAVAKSINAQARKTGKLKEKDANIPAEFLREGLTGVVSVKVPEPEFEGQTKTRLGNPEVRTIVDAAVSEALTTIFEWQPQVLAVIVNKAMEAQAAALAARAAREMVRRKSLLHSTVLPGKLADCSSRNPAETEIYVVEGDSAAGSAKQGRDRRTQAILPLRGKILNIEKASNEKIYQNAELQALISALGLGIRGAEFDVEQLRYHRIVIMTDADVDGSHIRILLLTFLYRYQRDLIHGGYVYIACPPLYKVTPRGKGSGKERYLFDQAEMDAYMAALPPGSSPPVIQRFKGLGEMMPEQLWSTTMDPERRILKLVTIDDASSADKMFSVLMGDNVQPRKEFITTNAERLKLQDLDY